MALSSCLLPLRLSPAVYVNQTRWDWLIAEDKCQAVFLLLASTTLGCSTVSVHGTHHADQERNVTFSVTCAACLTFIVQQLIHLQT